MGDFFAEGLGNFLFGLLIIWWLVSRYLNNNQNVKDAAKKAVAHKTINVIEKWLK